MASGVTITVKASALVRRTRGAARDLSDFRATWPDVRRMFSRWMREQFRSEGAWGGRPWARLSPSAAAQKARLYPGRGILVATGELRERAVNPVVRSTGTSLTMEIDDDVAGFHQTGTRYMPARPIIPAQLPREARRELQQVGEQHVRRTLNRWSLT